MYHFFFQSAVTKTKNGEWEIANGEWGMGNGSDDGNGE